MDNYTSKTAFQKWVSSIKLDLLSEEAKRTIQNFDYYSKKLDFRTTIKVLLHSVYKELPRFHEIDCAFMDQRLCQEVGIDYLCYSSLSCRSKEIIQEVLMEIFTRLVRQVADRKPSSKTTSLQIIDSTTLFFNNT